MPCLWKKREVFPVGFQHVFDDDVVSQKIENLAEIEFVFLKTDREPDGLGNELPVDHGVFFGFPVTHFFKNAFFFVEVLLNMSKQFVDQGRNLFFRCVFQHGGQQMVCIGYHKTMLIIDDGIAAFIFALPDQPQEVAGFQVWQAQIAHPCPVDLDAVFSVHLGDENGGIGTTDTIFNGFSPLMKGNAKAGRQGRHFAELVILDGMADTFGDLSCRHDIRVWKDKDEFSVLPSSEQIG